MKLRLLSALLCCKLLFAGVTPPDLPREATPQETYGPRLLELFRDEALRYGKEGSWSKSRDLYEAALPGLTDANKRRWCALWLADAAWRAEARPQDWQAAQAWEMKHEAAFESLLKPYENGKLPKDAFWLSARRSLIDLQSNGRPWAYPAKARLSDWLELADYLGSQTPTRDTAQAYAALLHEACAGFLTHKQLPSPHQDQDNPVSELKARLFHHLNQVASCELLPAADRAWATLRLEMLTQREGMTAEQSADRWLACVQATRNTPWQVIAEACVFVDSLANQQAGRVPATPPDIPALLTQLHTHQQAMNPLLPAPEAASLIKELKQLEKAWTTPQLQLMSPDAVEPGKPLIISYGQCGLRGLKIELFRSTPEAFLGTYKRLARNTEAPAANAEGLQSLLVREPSLPASSSFAWKSECLELDSALKPGLYLLVFSSIEGDITQTQVRNIICSDLEASLLSPARRTARLWVGSRSKKTPWSDAALTLTYAHDEGTARRSKTSYHPDEEGLVMLTDGWIDRGSGRYSLIISSGDHHAVLDTWQNEKPPVSRLVGDVFVERALFRPGETVNFKLILRERREGDWALPQDHFRLSIAGPEGKLADIAPLVLDKNGCYIGRVAIPADQRPGMVFLLLFPADSKEDKRPLQQMRLCQIDNYTPPPVTAALELASPADSLRPGQEIRIRAKASYFSGGPVSRAKARLQLSMDSLVHDMDRSEDQEMALWLRALSDKPQEAETNALGEAFFSLQVPAKLKGQYQLHLNLALSPTGFAPLSANASWNLSDSGLFLEDGAPVAARWAKPGTEIVHELRLLDGSGKTSTRKLEARLVRKEWLELWLNPSGELVMEHPAGFPYLHTREGKVSDSESVPAGWKLLCAEYQEKVLETKPVDNTAGTLKTRFTVPGEGFYALQLWSGDQQVKINASNFAPNFGRQGAGPLSLLVADENTQNLPLAPEEAWLLTGAAGGGGQEQTVLAVLPQEAAQGFLACVGETQVSAQTIRGPNRVHLCKLTVPEESNPQYTLTLHLPGTTSIHRIQKALSLNLEKEVPGNTAQLNLNHATNQVRPGSELKLRLISSERSGTAVPASIALSISDDALNQLLGYPANLASSFNNPEPSLSCTFNSNTKTPDGLPILPIHDLRPGLGGGLSADENQVILTAFSLTSEKDMFAGAIPNPGFLRIPSLKANGIAPLSGLLSYTRNTEIGGVSPSSITLRRHFASTALWAPDLRTDDKGEAGVTLRLPDNLTRWRAEAYAVADDGRRFATASTTFEAELPFQARLSSPRVLIEGDRCDLQATLVNRAEQALQATASLKGTGSLKPLSTEAASLAVPALGENRQTWSFAALAPGKASLTLTARAAAESDAMEISFAVLEDGLRLPLAASTQLLPKDKQREFSIELPTPLDPERSELELRLTPSLAGAMFDALPYLVDYPYGCIEQTLSRFVPAVVVKAVLAEQGLDPVKLEQRILARGGLHKEQAQSLDKLDDVIAKSLERLKEGQQASGGFGWWPGSPYTDLWMSAYVSWGLNLASSHGVTIPGDMKEKLQLFLAKEVYGKENTPDDTQAWLLAALAGDASLPKTATPELEKILKRCYEARQSLGLSGRACLGLALKRWGTAEQQATILRNLENGVIRSKATGFGEIAQWGSGSGYSRAQDGATEATALSLLALLDLQPDHPLIQPAALGLVLNRRSANWGSTRGSAFAVLALSRYLQVRREAQPDLEVEVSVNGRALQRLRFDKDALLNGPLPLKVPASSLKPGANKFTLRRLSGKSPLFAIALAKAWAAGDAVKPAGHGLQVSRGFEAEEQRRTLAGLSEPVRVTLAKGTAAQKGARVQASLRLSTPQDLEYLMLEVPKPAGCEPLNPLSTWDAELRPVSATDKGTTRLLYREEHDDRSVLFIDRLPAGEWEIRLPLQAVLSGDYRALPVRAEAMYVPEFRANSASTRLTINQGPE